MSGREILTAARQKGSRASKQTSPTMTPIGRQPRKRKDGGGSSNDGSPVKSPRTSLDHVSPGSSHDSKHKEYSIQILEEKLEKQERTIEEQRDKIDAMMRKLDAERKAKEDALTRLSSMASIKLRDNNPGITDLSDPNRPLKLAERVSELYDNEWTNAMEALEMVRSFKPSKSQNQQAEIFDIHLLRNIFTECFSICQEEARKQLQELPRHVIMPSIVLKENSSKMDSPDLPNESYKTLKDFRKHHSDRTIKELQPIVSREVKQKLKISAPKFKACDTYMKECVSVCWLMAVQDPPVVIKWDYETGTDFDNNIMRTYTRSGDQVEYVVWPVLYLHHKGPILAKGVVQGRKTEKS